MNFDQPSMENPHVPEVEKSEPKNVEEVEVKIIKEQIEDLKRSLEKNIQAKELIGPIVNRYVVSSDYLVSALGTPLMLVEETRKLRDLIRKRNSYDRNNPEREKAQNELIKFQNENKNEIIDFNFGPRAEDSSVLIKGVNGANIGREAPLSNALETIINNQNTRITELENKLKEKTEA